MFRAVYGCGGPLPSAGGAPGMAMSSAVTLPSPSSGGWIYGALPTTTIARFSGRTYFCATRTTSAEVTFSTPAR